MIKVKLLPMQFYDCISVDNRYYSCDDVKYMGATIDAVFPCIPGPGDPILLPNLDLDKIYKDWVVVMEDEWLLGFDSPIKCVVEEMRSWPNYNKTLSDRDILHEIIYSDEGDSMFDYEYCASETMKPIFIQGEDYVVLPIDNVTFRNKKETKTSRFFKVIEVEDA